MKRMKVETLLPLGKLDPGLREPETPLDIRTVFSSAQEVEALGYDGMVVEETKDDPYVILGLAAQATQRVTLSTSVALAFPRSPTITAMSAWTLQKLSNGRFILGLGTQVKGHIERRFGLKWSSPGAWMREYIQAVRAIWSCWQNGTPLNFQGERYKLNLMVPLFTPTPIEHPNIPIQIAAVNPYICQVGGEVADGIRPHPVCTPSYIRNVMLPAVAKGAAKAGRNAKDIAVCMKPFVATAPDEATLRERMQTVRARLAFYGSTPAYRVVFEAHGLGDLATELNQLSRQQRWEEMPPLVSDEMIETFATVGTYDQIAARIKRRYGGLITHIEFGIQVRNDTDRGRLKEMIQDLQQAA
jgi:probable F420-dependent oxidoreductase